MANINQTLDVSKVPKLVGASAKKTFNQCYSLLDNTRWPLYITGPSGSGKSIIAMNLAKKYSREYEVPAYYVQLSPEQTKTSLILGLRMIDGSLKAVNGVVADCMESGGIIIVDEATHTLQETLLLFNSILDRTSITSIGDKTVVAKETFRIIFCSNSSKYAANIKLPQSFAQRVPAFYFDYPAFEDEARIAKRIAIDECYSTIDTPKEVVKYITSLVREFRTESFPLSARNCAIALVLLSLAEKDSSKGIDEYFTKGQNVEGTRRAICNRIFNEQAFSSIQLNGEEMNTFTKYVSSVGIEQFKEIILQSLMYYLDVEQAIFDEDIKNKMKLSII